MEAAAQGFGKDSTDVESLARLCRFVVQSVTAQKPWMVETVCDSCGVLHRRAAWTHSSGVNKKRRLYLQSAKVEESDRAQSDALRPIWNCLRERVNMFARSYLDTAFY